MSVSAELAAAGDRRLARLVEGATGTGTGIGGDTGVVRVGGVPVFVKRVPLTDRERAPAHWRSTANLFGLPAFYQYGIGSAGFGAWRELAAHTVTSRWVRDGTLPAFPLLHHWRVLPREPRPAAELDGAVAYWDGSAAVRDRLTELAAARASVVLFLEHVPHTLDGWLRAGGDPEPAERELAAVTAATAARGLVHFDAHPGNVLTDGRRFLLGDLGLAQLATFALSPAERAFHRAHRDFDRHDVMAYLANWVVTHHLPGADPAAVLRRCAAGDVPAGLPAAGLLRRHAAAALVAMGFRDALVRGPKDRPYPAAELASVRARA